MRSLRILTFNTWKSPQIINAIIHNPEFFENFDILCIQEPPKKLIEFSKFWNTIQPYNISTLQNRTLVYINSKIKTTSYSQIALQSSRDAIAFDLTTETSTARIINIYNPVGCKWEESPIQLIIPLLETPSEYFLHLSGDFNLHHSDWDPSYTKSVTSAAEAF